MPGVFLHELQSKGSPGTDFQKGRTGLWPLSITVPFPFSARKSQLCPGEIFPSLTKSKDDKRKEL